MSGWLSETFKYASDISIIFLTVERIASLKYEKFYEKHQNLFRKLSIVLILLMIMSHMSTLYNIKIPTDNCDIYACVMLDSTLNIFVEIIETLTTFLILIFGAVFFYYHQKIDKVRPNCDTDKVIFQYN